MPHLSHSIAHTTMCQLFHVLMMSITNGTFTSFRRSQHAGVERKNQNKNHQHHNNHKQMSTTRLLTLRVGKCVADVAHVLPHPLPFVKLLHSHQHCCRHRYFSFWLSQQTYPQIMGLSFCPPCLNWLFSEEFFFQLWFRFPVY